MSITEIMSAHVVTVQMDDKLMVVKAIFDNVKFHHLLVVDNNELVGVVSDRDLLKAISPNIGTFSESYKDGATLNKRVHQIMTRHPVMLDSDATVDDAIDLFLEKKISCIPIVNKNTKIVGIVSWRDILKNLRNK